MTNINEYRIFGMRRSGNHFIISSIMSCFNKNEVYFFNDLPDPINIYKSLNRAYHDGNVDKFPQLADRLVTKDMYNYDNIINSNKKCLIQSYEDNDLNIVIRLNEQNIGKTINKFNILILRDCYNWLASRLQHVKKHKVGTTKVTPNIINIWKQYAKEYLGITNYLGNNKILINYNQFVIDKEYQKDIIEKLSLDYKLLNTDVVSAFGKGSSFVGMKCDDNKQNYNERWKVYMNDPTFKKLIDDPELIELSDKIFGKIYSSK